MSAKKTTLVLGKIFSVLILKAGIPVYVQLAIIRMEMSVSVSIAHGLHKFSRQLFLIMCCQLLSGRRCLYQQVLYVDFEHEIMFKRQFYSAFAILEAVELK